MNGAKKFIVSALENLLICPRHFTSLGLLEIVCVSLVGSPNLLEGHHLQKWTRIHLEKRHILANSLFFTLIISIRNKQALKSPYVDICSRILYHLDICSRTQRQYNFLQYS